MKSTIIFYILCSSRPVHASGNPLCLSVLWDEIPFCNTQRRRFQSKNWLLCASLTIAAAAAATTTTTPAPAAAPIVTYHLLLELLMV